MAVDTEGRVRVFARARWPVMVAAWSIAVVLITLLTSRVIHVVGRQLTSAVSLPRPEAARAPVLLPPQTVLVPPGARQRPRPASPPPPSATASAGGAGATVAAGTAAASLSGASTARAHRPIPTPRASRPAPPPTVTDQRVVQTTGGQAAFTCTSSDRLTLLYATPAPGYTAEPPRVRSASRMDVTFDGAHEQKIDARCSDGRLQAEVEV